MRDLTQEEVARRALEVACARADMETAKQLYSGDFVDHVNGEVFHGYEGIRHTITLYQRLFRDFAIRVDDQVSEGDKVASRFTLSGSRAGRRVSVSGIVVSRFEDGKIVEDWSITDTSSLMRQLGVRGTLAVAFTWLRSRS